MELYMAIKLAEVFARIFEKEVNFLKQELEKDQPDWDKIEVKLGIWVMLGLIGMLLLESRQNYPITHLFG